MTKNGCYYKYYVESFEGRKVPMKILRYGFQIDNRYSPENVPPENQQEIAVDSAIGIGSTVIINRLGSHCIINQSELFRSVVMVV